MKFSDREVCTSERWMWIIEMSPYGSDMQRWKCETVRLTMPGIFGIEQLPLCQELASFGINTRIWRKCLEILPVCI